MIVEQYWSGIARRLQVESSVLNRLIPHNLERGIQNELSLARVIENFIPPNLAVGSGIIFDHKGRVSRQTDIILFDRSAQPQLLAQTHQVLFPVETVKMAIEVKTRISSEDLNEFAVKKSSIRDLEPSSGFKCPPFGMFAYAFADSDYGRAQDIRNMIDDDLPDLACVIEPGYVIDALGSNHGGFVPLHSRDKENRRIPKTWRQPPNESKGSTALIDGLQHPVFQLGKYSGPRYCGEPGRALLIFCSAMLHLLGDPQHSWISDYMSSQIREILVLDETP